MSDDAVRAEANMRWNKIFQANLEGTEIQVEHQGMAEIMEQMTSEGYSRSRPRDLAVRLLSEDSRFAHRGQRYHRGPGHRVRQIVEPG
eukprot:634797-Prymnesium_polylepis.1